MEAIQERYLRWILGLDKSTPGYIVREEMKRHKLRVESGKVRRKITKGREWRDREKMLNGTKKG